MLIRNSKQASETGSPTGDKTPALHIIPYKVNGRLTEKAGVSDITLSYACFGGQAPARMLASPHRVQARYEAVSQAGQGTSASPLRAPSPTAMLNPTRHSRWHKQYGFQNVPRVVTVRLLDRKDHDEVSLLLF